MKKVISFALVLVMLACFSVTALAENATPGTTTLTTTVPAATYTLNIPADQEIPFGTTSMDIGAPTVTNSSSFAVGKNLAVTMTWDDFSCPETTTTIPFTLKGHFIKGFEYADIYKESGDQITFKGNTDGTVGQYAWGRVGTTTTEMQYLYIEMKSTDWGKALAGDYSATITFTSEVVVAD